MARGLFLALLAISCGYALWRGDRDARIVAAISLGATILTHFVITPIAHRYTSIEDGVLAVDLATFAGFTAIALYSSRFWPLWVAGLQLTTLIGHALKAIDWSLLPRAYGAAMIFWSYPILVIVLVGAIRSRRRRAGPALDPPLA